MTGGVVYRGNIGEIYGHYFFADYCSERIWSFRWDGDAVLESEVVDRTSELEPAEGRIDDIVAFGEDGFGEMYIVDLDGEIYQVLPEPGAEASAVVLATLGLLARRRRAGPTSGRRPAKARATPSPAWPKASRSLARPARLERAPPSSAS